MERVVLGWSPVGNEDDFAISPKRFSCMHGLSPCQAGAVSFLSRYQFERNPWLLKQSCLLVRLIIDYGEAQLSVVSKWRKYFGLTIYLAPRTLGHEMYTIKIASYCLVNGIEPKMLLPLSLICESPTRTNLLKAIELIENID